VYNTKHNHNTVQNTALFPLKLQNAQVDVNINNYMYNLYVQLLPRDAMLCRYVMSVHPSVTFDYSIKTNKHICKIYVTSG